jgi:hypothetical protein
LSGSLALETVGSAPSETFGYVLRATMLQAGNYTVSIIMRSTGTVAAATTFGCLPSVVCASRSVVTSSLSALPLAEPQRSEIQVTIASFDMFGNARDMEWFSPCTAHASATAVTAARDVLSVAVNAESCQCCTSPHLVMAGGPAVSSSPAPIYPQFNIFTGALSSAAVATDHSLGTSSRGYVLQPPVSVLTSALPLLKLQLIESASASLWPDESRAAGTPLALVQGSWNASSQLHVFSAAAPPGAAVIRTEPFQLLHGSLLATCVPRTPQRCHL